MFPIDFLLSLGRLFGKVLLVPLLAHAQLRKLKPSEPYLLESIGKTLRVRALLHGCVKGRSCPYPNLPSDFLIPTDVSLAPHTNL